MLIVSSEPAKFLRFYELCVADQPVSLVKLLDEFSDVFVGHIHIQVLVEDLPDVLVGNRVAIFLVEDGKYLVELLLLAASVAPVVAYQIVYLWVTTQESLPLEG